MAAAASDLKQLEERLAKLEAQCRSDDREEIRRLWKSLRKEQDLSALFGQLKEATRDRKAPKRAQIHGIIDTLVANGDDVLPATPTIILTSSEPCALVVFTAITATICD
jgi:HPt (histidine-containing phosphotransfer) domain-containing protein